VASQGHACRLKHQTVNTQDEQMSTTVGLRRLILRSEINWFALLALENFSIRWWTDNEAQPGFTTFKRA
jgi:hypothetical protein